MNEILLAFLVILIIVITYIFRNVLFILLLIPLLFLNEDEHNNTFESSILISSPVYGELRPVKNKLNKQFIETGIYIDASDPHGIYTPMDCIVEKLEAVKGSLKDITFKALPNEEGKLIFVLRSTQNKKIYILLEVYVGKPNWITDTIKLKDIQIGDEFKRGERIGDIIIDSWSDLHIYIGNNKYISYIQYNKSITPKDILVEIKN